MLLFRVAIPVSTTGMSSEVCSFTSSLLASRLEPKTCISSVPPVGSNRETVIEEALAAPGVPGANVPAPEAIPLTTPEPVSVASVPRITSPKTSPSTQSVSLPLVARMLPVTFPVGVTRIVSFEAALASSATALAPIADNSPAIKTELAVPPS